MNTADIIYAGNADASQCPKELHSALRTFAETCNGKQNVDASKFPLSQIGGIMGRCGNAVTQQLLTLLASSSPSYKRRLETKTTKDGKRIIASLQISRDAPGSMFRNIPRRLQHFVLKPHMEMLDAVQSHHTATGSRVVYKDAWTEIERCVAALSGESGTDVDQAILNQAVTECLQDDAFNWHRARAVLSHVTDPVLIDLAARIALEHHADLGRPIVSAVVAALEPTIEMNFSAKAGFLAAFDQVDALGGQCMLDTAVRLLDCASRSKHASDLRKAIGLVSRWGIAADFYLVGALVRALVAHGPKDQNKLNIPVLLARLEEINPSAMQLVRISSVVPLAVLAWVRDNILHGDADVTPKKCWRMLRYLQESGFGCDSIGLVTLAEAGIALEPSQWANLISEEGLFGKGIVSLPAYRVLRNSLEDPDLLIQAAHRLSPVEVRFCPLEAMTEMAQDLFVEIMQCDDRLFHVWLTNVFRSDRACDPLCAFFAGSLSRWAMGDV